ncbi:hypothetical protein [Rhodopila sp.]
MLRLPSRFAKAFVSSVTIAACTIRDTIAELAARDKSGAAEAA